MTTRTPAPIDIDELRVRVKDMYRAVAETPNERFHFETGRGLAERLGYPPDLLDAIPDGAIESFAGVGYFFDLADVRPAETVVDLGSGAGMDAFIAARLVGEHGSVVGIDMTDQQLAKARRLSSVGGITNVTFEHGSIDRLPFEDASVDVVISNGVINLVSDKEAVFAETSRILRPGGRLAIADIVTEVPLIDEIVADVDLWASCIGGAPEQGSYKRAMARTGLRVETTRSNPYQFLSEQARNASDRFGVKSVSVLARRSGPR